MLAPGINDGFHRQARRQEAIDVYHVVITLPVCWQYSTQKLADLAWSSYRAICPHRTPNTSYKLQCSVGKPCFPTFSLQIRTKNPDAQTGAEMNYFHGLEKAGFWKKKRARGACACGF
jgi:hypothetical protein